MKLAGLDLPLDRPWRVLGLMSGTSADGIDSALVEIDPRGFNSGTPFKSLLHHQYEAYPDSLKIKVLEAIHNHSLPKDICILQRELGNFCGEIIKLISNNSKIDFVSLHGQTIQHHPEQGATLQLADPYVISLSSQSPVVWDLRRMDMALGGQGAPLVPLTETWLRGTKQPWVALNIGGIANVTAWTGCELQAWDTGPGMSILDIAARIWLGISQDEHGKNAMGKIHQDLLEHWMKDDYFRYGAPKSTGRERFGQAWFESHRTQLETLPITDRLATLASFTASSIQFELKRLTLESGTLGFVSGGGSMHSRVMSELSIDSSIHWSKDTQFPIGSREAISWALLGAASALSLPGTVQEITGASKAGILGSWVL